VSIGKRLFQIRSNTLLLENLTAILAFLTGLYAWITFQMLKANKETIEIMRAQIEALNRPFIQISTFLKPKSPMIYLKIKNTGRAAAEATTLRMNKDFYVYRENDKNIKDLQIFNQQIEGVPPDTEFIIALGRGFDIFGNSSEEVPTPTVFSIDAKYGFGLKQYSEKTTIDLKPYSVSQYSQDSIVDQLDLITNELEKIRKTIEEKK
jgi:hypothetical protein